MSYEVAINLLWHLQFIDYSQGTWNFHQTRFDDKFQVLGAGCFRTAYLSFEDNRVYKVDRMGHRKYRGGNFAEWRAYESAMSRDLPSWVRLPETKLWNWHGQYVIEQELIERPDGYHEPVRGWRNTLERLGFGDLHAENYAVLKGGVIALWDLGHSSPSNPADVDWRAFKTVRLGRPVSY